MNIVFNSQLLPKVPPDQVPSSIIYTKSSDRGAREPLLPLRSDQTQSPSYTALGAGHTFPTPTPSCVSKAGGTGHPGVT